ncbi:hypothetical protein F511_04591 [Dorcoceras hygrometricum]|uniref:Uncharacterized protein n=1 Tax=Dorcoceras hygrometricum TaxID=472368 RepID=A0A2Z7B771_9LAMI|nr:hypothetical protein F511_04591 [Dorcoceras hygrometricum]
MKPRLRMLFTYVLALALVLRLCGHRAARATRLPSGSVGGTSRTLRDLHVKGKHPYKMLNLSRRIIPPTGSNPTQNKCNPP